MKLLLSILVLMMSFTYLSSVEGADDSIPLRVSLGFGVSKSTHTHQISGVEGASVDGQGEAFRSVLKKPLTAPEIYAELGIIEKKDFKLLASIRGTHYDSTNNTLDDQDYFNQNQIPVFQGYFPLKDSESLAGKIEGRWKIIDKQIKVWGTAGFEYEEKDFRYKQGREYFEGELVGNESGNSTSIEVDSYTAQPTIGLRLEVPSKNEGHPTAIFLTLAKVEEKLVDVHEDRNFEMELNTDGIKWAAGGEVGIWSCKNSKLFLVGSLFDYSADGDALLTWRDTGEQVLLDAKTSGNGQSLILFFSNKY